MTPLIETNSIFLLSYELDWICMIRNAQHFHQNVFFFCLFFLSGSHLKQKMWPLILLASTFDESSVLLFLMIYINLWSFKEWNRPIFLQSLCWIWLELKTWQLISRKPGKPSFGLRRGLRRARCSPVICVWPCGLKELATGLRLGRGPWVGTLTLTLILSSSLRRSENSPVLGGSSSFWRCPEGHTHAQHSTLFFVFF